MPKSKSTIVLTEWQKAEQKRIRHAAYMRFWRMRNPDNWIKFLERHPGYYKNYRKKNRRRLQVYWNNWRHDHIDIIKEREVNSLGTTDFGPHISKTVAREQEILRTEFKKLRLGNYISNCRGDNLG